MAKCLKTVISILLFISLSACGVSQEHNTDSDIETVYEKQESDLQTEEAGISMPFQEEVSQEMELEEKDTVLQIQVQDSNHTIIFELNDSPAARSLYDQLPTVSTNEKIFYPPEKLDTENAVEGGGPTGSLAYFSPWGNVVMYYSEYGPYNGLYHLGNAVSGSEWIAELTGTLEIRKMVET